ncbi:MAG: element excision factor XisH family protein, partial [Dolichospermum sp.]
MAVEVKSFLGLSEVTEFHTALGHIVLGFKSPYIRQFTD